MSNTRFHKLTLIVPEDRRLELTLPNDFPTGPAELIVLSAAAMSAAAGAPPQPANRAEPRTSVLDELRSRLRTGRETHGWEELDAIRLRRKRGSARWNGSDRTAGADKRRSPGRG
ncbi:MAG TPA: hypothetical protein VEL74_08950 [Thermoanaerobaculia bacterium]|nr:hypothetical protein [Thermoanaerobaculia bacterium]